MKFNLNALLNLLLIGVLLLMLGRQVFKPRFDPGQAAPDFAAALANGDSLRLSQLRGHYVLLDFWGSWCGPCRRQNPALVRLYEKYHNAPGGLRIVSVGIERNESAWRRAIERDGLSWPYHILDKSISLKLFSGKIAGRYGVTQIPTTFLIDPKGNILGVDLAPGQIDQLLAKLVGFQSSAGERKTAN